MHSIVTKYNSISNTEFEIRTTINVTYMNKLIAWGVDYPNEVTQTINVISNNTNNKERSNDITTLHFTNSKKSHTTYGNKQPLIRPLDVNHKLLKYRISLSKELEIPAYEVTKVDFYRLKWRTSIILPNWQIDITIIRELLGSETNILKSTKDGFFQTFTGAAKQADRIELEMERTTKPLDISDIDDIISLVYTVIDKNYMMQMEYQKEIYRLAAHIVPQKELVNYRDKMGIKQLTNQVRDLTQNTLPDIDPGQYYITDKADGERALAWIDGTRLIILSSTVDYRELKNANANGTPLTIVDAELVDGTLYIFDILYFNGENLSKSPLEKRVVHLEAAAKLCECQYKRMERLKSDRTQLKAQLIEFKKYVSKRPYSTDGYILTPNKEYHSLVYKVKYVEMISIDFLIMQAPSASVGILPYTPRKGQTMYFLFSGISNYMMDKFHHQRIQHYAKIFEQWDLNPGYYPIQFAPSSDPFAYIFYSADTTLEGKIGELKRVKDEWKLMRIREDRSVEVTRGNYYGNDFAVAENIWQAMRNPVQIEDLYVKREDYFQVNDNPLYKAQRAFNSYVKSTLIGEFSTGYSTAIDLGSGKGQDISRYAVSNFESVLFIDLDETALQELVSRKRTMKDALGVTVLQADLNLPFHDTVKKIHALGISGVPLIVCNLTVHYLVSSMDAIRNLIGLVKTLLLPGGSFQYTAFDGERIVDLLSKGDWNAREGTVLKYSIKKAYKENKILLGQKINVLLPFTNGEYYEESLVNVKLLNDTFCENGFAVNSVRSFESFIPSFKDKNTLSVDDKKFVSLYTSVVLKNKSKIDRTLAKAKGKGKSKGKSKDKGNVQ